MKGLILKDVFNIKQQSKVYLILVVIWGVIAFRSNDPYSLSFLISFISAMLPITAFAYDDKAKWDKYGLSMPVSRSDMVISKYMLVLITSVASFLIVAALSTILFGFSIEVMMSYLNVLGISIIIVSFVLPLIFKFGVEKGRVVMLIVFLLLSLVMMSTNSADVDELFLKAMELINSIFPIVVVVLFLISIMLSSRIYRKKEF